MLDDFTLCPFRKGRVPCSDKKIIKDIEVILDNFAVDSAFSGHFGYVQELRLRKTCGFEESCKRSQVSCNPFKIYLLLKIGVDICI
jgi:hypothetical protein